MENGELFIIENGELRMENNIIKEKSFKFAVNIVNIYKYLMDEKKEFVLSKQILRSGTSIGANINEALQGQSKKDFLSKMNISLKECVETMYWIELLYETKFIDEKVKQSLYDDCFELKKILASIVKTTKERL